MERNLADLDTVLPLLVEQYGFVATGSPDAIPRLCFDIRPFICYILGRPGPDRIHIEKIRR